MEEQNSRRPIESRNAGWARRTAAWLAKKNVSPNAISLMSIVFAAGSLVALKLGTYRYYSDDTMRMVAKGAFLVVAIVFIQLRLIMNLLDGMVAVEHNRKSVLGGLFNEIPDRISDTLTIFGLGFYVSCVYFGWTMVWLAISLSILTAYLRTLGASLGTPHFFLGPMAKQHRMALICAGCVVEIFWTPAIFWVLIIMNVGLVVTCIRRVAKIVSALKQNG